jgi:hypothetical protein
VRGVVFLRHATTGWQIPAIGEADDALHAVDGGGSFEAHADRHRDLLAADQVLADLEASLDAGRTVRGDERTGADLHRVAAADEEDDEKPPHAWNKRARSL